MLDITFPILLIVVAAGLPSLALLLLIITLMRLRGKKKKQSINDFRHDPVEPFSPYINGFDGHIHHELLEQQIDAVFNALSTVLETERIKLKALVNHAPPAAVTPPPPRPSHHVAEAESTSPPSNTPPRPAAEPTIAEQVAAMTEDGMTGIQIAKQLGLSQAEVTLAMKMSGGGKIKGRIGRKVQAVA